MARARRGRGKGNIDELPSGKFRVVLSSGKDPATGKRRKLTFTADTKGKAQAWLRERQHEQNRGTLAHSGQTTLSEWLDRWVEMRKQDTAPATYSQYETHVRVHIKPLAGSIQLSQVKPMHIADIYAKMEAIGISAAMRFKLATTLRSAFKSAVEVGLIAVNPASKIKKPRVEKPPTDSWSLDEAQRFIAAMPSDDVFGKAFFMLALDSGMRQGEILGLHWSEVDLKDGAVRVV